MSSLYSQLKVDNVTQHQDITFVCHSLGGIVTERLLLDHPEVAARGTERQPIRVFCQPLRHRACAFRSGFCCCSADSHRR